MGVLELHELATQVVHRLLLAVERAAECGTVIFVPFHTHFPAAQWAVPTVASCI